MSELPSTPERKAPLLRRKKRMHPALQAFLLALALYGFGALFFFVLHAMEQNGGAATVHWFVALLYALGGKWTVAVVFGLLGTLMLVCAILFLLPPRKKP